MINLCFRALRRFSGWKKGPNEKRQAIPKKEAAVEASIDEVLQKSMSNHITKLGAKEAAPKSAQSLEAEQGSPAQPKTRGNNLSRLKKLSDVDVPTFEEPRGPISGLYSSNIVKNLTEKRLRSEQELQRYMRGESGIQVTPVASLFSVKYKRLMSELKRLRSKMTVNEEEANSESLQQSPKQRAQKIREYRELYANYELQADLEKFEGIVSQYPGSRLGPLPEDDPESFMSYLENKAPKSVLKLMKLSDRDQNRVMRKLDEGKNPALEEYTDVVDESNIPYLQHDPPDAIPLDNINPGDENYEMEGEQLRFASKTAFFEHPHDIKAMTTQEAHIKFFETHEIEDDTEEVPSLPKFKYKSYQQMWPILIDWVNFRSVHDMHTLGTFVQESALLIEATLNASPKIRQPVKMGSLYYYYKTLPQEFQDHPALKDIYLGLEYSCPDKSLQEKEKALNFAAFNLLPLDPFSQSVVEEHCSDVSKYQPSPDEVEKVYNMKPEFTWDIGEYMKEIKEEQLRGEVAVQEKEPQQFIKPPTYSFESNGDANLPIDFWDNEDGFWDSYKAKKMERYQSTPMLKNRPYLKH